MGGPQTHFAHPSCFPRTQRAAGVHTHPQRRLHTSPSVTHMGPRGPQPESLNPDNRRPGADPAVPIRRDQQAGRAGQAVRGAGCPVSGDQAPPPVGKHPGPRGVAKSLAGRTGAATLWPLCWSLSGKLWTPEDQLTLAGGRELGAAQDPNAGTTQPGDCRDPSHCTAHSGFLRGRGHGPPGGALTGHEGTKAGGAPLHIHVPCQRTHRATRRCPAHGHWGQSHL